MKLGLVLGSGAARGWAHIGVVRALQEMGITPHVVTGTSIGSLVGAALASGKMTELEEWVRGLTNWQVLGLLDWGLGKGGLVSGQRMFDKVADILGALTFSELALPFGAVATNLQTGRETWLTDGELRAAIRCSCAIPGLLAPAYHQGQWLVDGATVNPVPVSICRALGADFVIAVDLNSDKSHQRVARQLWKDSPSSPAAEGAANAAAPSPTDEQHAAEMEDKLQHLQMATPAGNELDAEQQALNPDALEAAAKEAGPFAKLLNQSKDYLQQFGDRQEADKAPGVLTVMTGCIDIMQDRITRSRLAGEPPDIVLQPKAGGYGIMEFHRANELIQEGERCVKASKNILEYELEYCAARERSQSTNL